MDTPVTTIDPRYSAPGAVATGWDETRHVLEAAELFWISTVRADGRPHVTPLVAVWFDGAMHFITGPTEQKTVNLSANPHVILTTGCNGWQAGLDVVVEGDAIQVTDDTRLERLAEVWATKWDGRWKFLVRDGHYYDHDDHAEVPNAIIVFSVTPSQILVFAKAPFGHTRHRWST
jgi:nitroimidazol reductase NimA-like FMN-containing flavoprotein (pyridoxamine 5'-phosphate oxidase superfamily)